jgi:hypothetical protein
VIQCREFVVIRRLQACSDSVPRVCSGDKKFFNISQFVHFSFFQLFNLLHLLYLSSLTMLTTATVENKSLKWDTSTKSILSTVALIVALNLTVGGIWYGSVAAMTSMRMEEPPLENVKLISCVDPDVDCDGHGRCVKSHSNATSECKCDSNYVTHDCPLNVHCCYHQRSRTGVFLLAFFVGFTGAHYFVVGQNGLGAGILTLFCVFAFSRCMCMPPEDRVRYAKSEKCAIWWIGMLKLAVGCWQLACWIQLAAQTEPYDDNGVPIAPW